MRLPHPLSARCCPSWRWCSQRISWSASRCRCPPLHVHQGLGLGTFVVGLVAGSQFAASLISRFWAGHRADSRGAKHAVVTGLVVAVLAGLLYLLSLRFIGEPDMSVTMLLLGRAMLGGAESFIVAGALIWGLALGRAKVALVCVLIEAAGQALIWLAPGSELVLIGAALTGFGYSLVYPGFGSKRFVARRRRAEASPWEPTPRFSTWRWGSPIQP